LIILVDKVQSSQDTIAGFSCYTEPRPEAMTTPSECGMVIAFDRRRLGEFLKLKGNRKVAQSFCKAHARVMDYNHSNLRK